MADTPSDADLIRVSLSAPEEFALVFERHWDAVFCYFERRLGRDLAADLASDVFRIAFERRVDYDVESRAGCRPWLYGIAANLALKERRRFARYVNAVERFEAVTIPEDEDHAEAVSEGVDSEAAWPRLRAALFELDDESREMLLLVAWENLSYRDVANAFNVPVGTVRSRIHRARGVLRSQLGSPLAQHPRTPVVKEETRND